jgi:hypothetical protein
MSAWRTAYSLLALNMSPSDIGDGRGTEANDKCYLIGGIPARRNGRHPDHPSLREALDIQLTGFTSDFKLLVKDAKERIDELCQNLGRTSS